MEKRFLLLSVVFGLAFVFLTPPLRSPDEAGHFVRAYQIAHAFTTSEARFEQEAPGTVAAPFLFWHDRAIQQETHPQNYAPAFEQAPKGADAERLVMPLAHSQAVMSPLAYPAQSLVIKALGTFHPAFLPMLYGARLFNMIVCLGLSLLALRLAPRGKELLAAVNLLPMAVFERSQMAVDGLVIAAACVALALMMRMGAERKNVALYIGLAVSLAVLAATKSIYLAVLLWLPLMGVSVRSLGAGALVAAPAVTISLWWCAFLASHRFVTEERAGLLDPVPKIALLLADPIEVCMRIFLTLWRHIFDWTGQMIGIFGAMDITLPLGVRFFGFAWLAALVVVFRQAEAKRCAVLMVVTFWIGVFLVLMTLFITWADPAAAQVGGVQGRYFLPLLPCLLWGLAGLVTQGPQFSDAQKQAALFLPAVLLLTVSIFYVVGHEWIN